MRHALVLAAAVAALALVGCGLHHHSGSSSTIGQGQGAPSFSSTLTTDQSGYRPGQTVTCTLTVTNLTDQTQAIHDAWLMWRITDSGGAVVDQTIPPPAHGPTESFAPHEARTFTFTWDQSIGGGAYSTGGTYTASGWLKANATPELTGTCQVLVIPLPPPPVDG